MFNDEVSFGWDLIQLLSDVTWDVSFFCFCIWFLQYRFLSKAGFPHSFKTPVNSIQAGVKCFIIHFWCDRENSFLAIIAREREREKERGCSFLKSLQKYFMTFVQIKFVSILVTKKIRGTDWLDPFRTFPTVTLELEIGQFCQNRDYEVRRKENMETVDIHYGLQDS